MAIAAKRHGAPAPPPRPRVIVEKEPARRVRANTKARARAFRNEFRGRAGDGGEEPVQTTFASDKFQTPFAVLQQEFVVTFGDAQDIVDRLDPVARHHLFAKQRCEDLGKGSMKPSGFGEEPSSTLRVTLRKGQQLRTTF